MADTFSFEDALGPTAQGPFVPADRTSKQKRSFVDPEDLTAKPNKMVEGVLPKDKNIFDAIVRAADEFNVPREYALALAQQESSYNPNAHNTEFGADGLFQFIESTAKGHGLQYGVDTRDPYRSAQAAMKDFAAQMAIGGEDWAIKHHFAGPDTSGHGPKTAQYLADVRKRAADIRQLLSDQGATNTGAVDTPKTQATTSVKTISFEEALGPQEQAPKDNSILGKVKDAANNTLDALESQYSTGSVVPDFFKVPVEKAAKGTFGYVRDRVLSELGVYAPDHPNFKPSYGQADPFAEIRDTRERIEERKAGMKPAESKSGFFANLENPFKLLTEDSLPANFVESLARAPRADREKFMEARKVSMQENIVANPDKFPVVAVQAAQEAIAQRKAKQDPNIRQMWDHLRSAANEDPGKFAAQFANALIADPEMLVAPVGVGFKPIQGASIVTRMASPTSRALRLADQIVDAGSTAAAMNLAIENSAAQSEGRQMTREEAMFSGAMGFAIGGGFGAIFAKGAGAKASLRSGKVTPADLEATMRDVAKEEVLTEELANAEKTDIIYDTNGKPLPADARQRIEQVLGIENMSKEQRQAWHKKRQAELAATFKEHWEEADYLKFKAEERITRAQQLAEDAEAKAAKQQAEAEEAQRVAAEFAGNNRERWQGEYDKALEARERAKNESEEAAWSAEEDLRTATKRLDEQEIIEGAFENSNEVERAMNRAARRDSNLRTPKWQRGEVDPKLVARLGVGSLFAGTAFAAADEDSKVQSAFAAGLAGLLLPAGGRVLDRMRQAGVVSLDGDLISMTRLVKEGKLKAPEDIATAKLAEQELVNRAKRGDQKAFQELWEGNVSNATRQAKKIIKNISARTGVDAEDVAQEAFVSAFKQIDQIPEGVSFGAYLYGIVKNKAVDAVRAAQTLKGGADVQTTSMYANAREGGDNLAGGHILDTNSDAIKGEVEAAAADMASPENEAIRQQTERVLIQSIQKLPDRDRLVFLLSRVEQYESKEIAQMMGISDDAVRQILSRAQKVVESDIERGFSAKRQQPQQSTKTGYRISLGKGMGARLGNSEGNGVYFFKNLDAAKKLHDQVKSGAKLESIEYNEPSKPLIVPKNDKSFLWDNFDEGVLLDPVESSDSDWVRFNKESYQQANEEFIKQYGYELEDHPNYHEGIQEMLLRAGDILTDKLKKAGYDAVVRNKGMSDEWMVLLRDDGYRGIETKRGRGRPRKIMAEAGEVDPRLLKLGAVAAMGAAGGAYLNEQNKMLGAGVGAIAASALLSRGVKGTSMAKQIVQAADYTLGVTSTRIMNKSKALWRRAIEHERIVLRDTHVHLKAGDNFLLRMRKLPKDTQDILTRAILTGKPEVTNRILEKIGDQELISGWKQLKSSLDSLGDQLVELKRFKRKELDYFPRIVKDADGLLKALGKERGSYLEEALKAAEEKAIRGRGTGLTELEKSLVINKVLKEDRWASQQPGFAKNRGIEEITPELQKYYATPLEAYHSYVRSAVEDIQRAKFFGQDLKVVLKNGQEYTNIGESIGTLTNRLLNEGKLSPKDAEEVAGLLRSRFMNGERAPSEVIQSAKNLSYAGLLGNPFSAAVQLGDVVIQAYSQDMRSTFEALARKLTGNSKVNMKDFGLADHIAEEFVSTSKSAKFLRTVFAASLFKGVDAFGKDIALNAAVLRFGRLARTEQGVQQLMSKYGEALGPKEFQQLITDLQKGEPTDLVNSVAFAELSRSQPITRLEMPQAYLDHPDGRMLYQFKTFMLKQIDLARRDGWNEIKAGNRAKGFKQLAELGLVLGVAGASTQKIKDFMLGREVDFKASDIWMNALKTYGLSQYFIDHFFGVSKQEAQERRADGDKSARTTQATPLQSLGGMFVPPAKMFDEIIRADPKAVRYIPLIGPYLYEKQQAEKAKKENSNG